MLIVRLAICAIVALLSGCREEHIYHHYTFEVGDVKVSGGLIKIRLNPSWREVRDEPPVTHHGSPYSIFVTVYSKSKPGTSVELEVTELSSNLQVIQLPVSVKGETRGESDDIRYQSVSRLSLGCFELGHTDLHIRGKLKVGGESAPFERKLSPTYREERLYEFKSRFLQAMMGI